MMMLLMLRVLQSRALMMHPSCVYRMVIIMLVALITVTVMVAVVMVMVVLTSS